MYSFVHRKSTLLNQRQPKEQRVIHQNRVSWVVDNSQQLDHSGKSRGGPMEALKT